MKTLFELARYNSNNQRLVENLMPRVNNRNLKKLLTIVFSKNIITDKEAMFAIYGTKKLSSFSNLKAELKEILIKITLMNNTSLENKHSRVNESINQYRHALVSKFLLQEKFGKVAIDIAERALVKSIKYSTSENIIILVRILVRHYGSTEFNRKKLNNYLSLQEKYFNIYSCELKAENYFLDLQRTNLHSFAPPDELTVKKAKKYVDELDTINNIRTYSFLLSKYKVKAIYFEYIKDYGGLLNLCDSIIKELGTTQSENYVTIQNINLRKAWALIQAERNDEVIVIGKKDLRRLPSGSSGWYFITHYTLKAYLYKADYKNAVELIKSTIENTGFLKIGINYRELFYTALGYIHLIVDSGIAGDPTKLKKNLPDFKIGKFLNTTPVFSKDKRGINVSILLMHIAILLQRKKYDDIIDRTDSLKQYAYRYLRKDDTFRSNCMIKMVIQMTKADFNPIRTERYTKDLLEQLKQVKLAGSGENIETEIIPHEVLWTIMMKSLQR